MVIYEPFDIDTGGFTVGKATDKDSSQDNSIKGGKYLIKVTSKGAIFSGVILRVIPLTDFFLSVEVKAVKSPSKADYGLIFRQEPDRLYYFYISAKARQYGVTLIDIENWQKIIYWKDSDLIDPAGANRLAVLAQGSEYTLFINGEKVDSFQDDILKNANVGLGFSLYTAKDYMALEFDNFELRAPWKD